MGTRYKLKVVFIITMQATEASVVYLHTHATIH